MSEPVPVLINAGGGTAASKGDKLEAEVRAAFAGARIDIDLLLLDGRDIQAAATRYAHLALVVVGGGDGTLGCAAGALIEGKAALGILPLGTRNHLARELDVPLDLPGAARLIAKGFRRRIDVARVNGRLFVNNASIGIYPELVRERDARQERLNLPKSLAAIPAAWAALKRMRHHRLRLHSPQGEREIVTPMLFVGNNHYALEAGQLGKRSALDDGLLSVFAVAARRRRALLGFALRTLAGRADPAEDFAALGDVPQLTVTGRSHHIDVALDGEVEELRMPLKFTIDRRALTVVAPDGG
jgi:diacylglycerol kinase family enzyme